MLLYRSKHRSPLLFLKQIYIIMTPRIDPHLLVTIKIEFKHGLRPPDVLEHLRDIGAPVSRSYLYLLYNCWRESGQLDADPEMYCKRGKP